MPKDLPDQKRMVEGLLARGQAYGAQGRLKEALFNLDAAIQNAPGKAAAYAARAGLYRQMGQMARASADEEMAAKLLSRPGSAGLSWQ